jgi:hypothetical protein
MILVEKGTLPVEEEGGHNDSFSVGMGHDSVLELARRRGINFNYESTSM